MVFHYKKTTSKKTIIGFLVVTFTLLLPLLYGAIALATISGELTSLEVNPAYNDCIEQLDYDTNSALAERVKKSISLDISNSDIASGAIFEIYYYRFNGSYFGLGFNHDTSEEIILGSADGTYWTVLDQGNPASIKDQLLVDSLPQANSTSVDILLIDNSEVSNVRLRTIYEYVNGTYFGIAREEDGEQEYLLRSENGQYWNLLLTRKIRISKPLDKLIGDIIDTFIGSFTNPGSEMPVLLIVLALTGAMVISVILGSIFSFVNPYEHIGTRFNTWFFRRVNGRLGWILHKTGLFDFDPDSSWFIEKHFVYNFEFYSTKTVLKELYVNRWRDIFFLPAAITIFVIVSLGIDQRIARLHVQGKGLLLGSDNPFDFILVAFLISLLVSLILAFYYPAVWTFSDIKLKRYSVSQDGDIHAFGNLGNTIRSGVELFFGFTTLFSIGSLGANLFNSENMTLSDILRFNVSSPALIILHIFDVLNFFIISIIAFIMITIFVVPSIAMMSFIHFRGNHIKLLVETRKALTAVGIPAATIQPNILSDELADIVEETDMSKLKN
ncbi:MAG: hypothetical protein ACFFD4_33050 [Candidatus Odinarchaeota archaeon]